MFNNGAFNQQDLLLNSLNQNSQPNHGMPPLGASGFTPEQQRLFHQMQMQQQAGGNQFRPQSGAGQDLMGGSSMNEMSALMGNAGIPARMNAQQQQLQQQQLAARGFNNNGQPTQQMLSMMGMGGGPANNRNSNPMLQAFPQGVLGASRQLDLMAAAQNQQNQNAPLHVQQMLFRQQQQQQQQQRAGLAGAGPSANLNGLRPGMGNGSTNMFPTSMDPRRTSPTHPQQNNMNGLANTMAGTANPQATLAQYNEKLQALRDSIVQMETELRQKTMQRAQGYLEISEDTLQTIATNLRIRKEHYTRLQSLVMRMRSGSIPNDGEHNLPGGSAGGPGQNGFPSQHGLGPSGSNQGAGPSSSPWMQNGGLGASFGVNGLQSGSQTSPANAAASLPQNVNAPPRSGPTPQSSLHATLGMQGTPQQSNSRLPSGSFSMSPSMSASLPFQQQSPAQNGAPFGGAGQLHPGLNGNPFPHLEKHRFEPIYNNFCSKHPDIKRDPRLFDGRPIDVYMLHVEVNREGGMNKVKANNAWPIIAARLGFAAPGPEPAKSTPDVAEQVAKCYQDCLGLFDTQLYQTMAETRRREMFMTMHNQANQATGGNNPAPNPAQLPALARLHPQQLQALVKYANLSVEHMRAQGLNASIIQLVENNRAGLQRYAMEQHAFRGSVKSGAAQNGMQQGVGSMAGPGGMPAENLALAGLQRPGLGGMGGGNIPQPQDIPIQLFVKVLDYLPLGESALQQATGLIERARVEFSNKVGLQRLPNKDVAPELRGRLATIIHQTMQVAQLMDARLHRFFLLVRAENTTKSLISAFAILRKQHELLQGTQPRFVMGVEELSMTLLKMKECADLAINQGKQFIQKAHMQNPQMLAQRGLPPGPPPPPMDPPQNVPSHTLPPQPGPAGSAVPPRPPVNLQPPPIGKHKKNVSTPAASPAGGNVAPTPPPTTPAVTPAQMAASPSNVKSPKNKPATRPKPKPVRRPSKATAPTPPSTSTPATEPQTPTIGKRQREDDPAQSPINGPSPPKRAKAEEEIAAPSQLPEDKTANLESKTDQEVAACLDQMKELVQQASQGDGSSSMNANIAEAFDELLKQSISLPDASGDGSMDMPGPLDGSLGMGGVDDSLSFFDWTAYGINADAPDGSDSVAPTPDLLHSSTNTSPESAAGGDADAAHSGAGEKHEEEQVAAHLNVGIWKDIEGGSESLYHQAAAEWKWDGVMPTLDQPWAISSG
ncbi:uncharacterized protein SCHCODRAFT_02626105 [Schizophyllum commune H4-8]|uniref:uncharacterized protein n=1 Tax=Schizophyllum commune (strain H4-8 / FGSC 9210) TaxID=578458 RepID=UPI00215EEC69|nr:uncharacterized protein SCHCODRAFT_02626105 [Schizophyllum commune H4-8]KAI5892411.1 hypothetical protein SCHCODRAFT_02626105 [Schizophyllum commune H4-8]